MATIAQSSLSAEQIIDRSKMKRRVRLWRILTVIALALAMLALLWGAGAFEGLGKRSNNHIARVSISGVIINDRPMLELLDKLAKEKQVKAVILDISSPGGSTVGGEAIYEAVRKLASKKPVVTTVGTLAASAGYMVASASDRIFSHRSSIVGSIGVYFQYANAKQLLDKIGVELGMVKSSPLKGEPAPFNEVTEAEKQMLRNLVVDSYDWFVGLVAERRNMPILKARMLADGRIFSGAQALKEGLVDEIGGEQSAREWLIANKKLSNELDIEEWKPRRNSAGSIFSGSNSKIMAGIVWLSRQLGVDLPPSTAESLSKTLPERLFLDGLISMFTISQ